MVLAVVELSFNPAGHAQDAPAHGEPQVQVQDNNAPPPAAPPPAAAAGPIVTLRADSRRARLQTQTQLTWQDVCVTPCNVAVSPAGTYRVGGGSIRPSESFTLPRASGQVVIDTELGSNIKHWVGVGLIILGAVDMVGGAVYYAAAAELADATDSTVGMDEEYFQTVGVGIILTGLVLLAIGIPLSTSHTKVTVR